MLNDKFRYYISSKRALLVLFALIISLKSYSSNLEIFLPNFNATVNSNVFFQWKKDMSAISYRIQISQSELMTNIIFDSLTTENSFTKNINTEGVYYWRYKISGNNFTTDWSATSTFTVFNPKSISGMLLWLKADSGIISRNDSIEQWTDLSGNNNHAIQPNELQRPVLFHNINQLNNQPTIRFNNTDDVSTSTQFSFFNLTTPISTIRDVFMVFKHQTGIQTYATILGSSVVTDYVSSTGTNMFGYASANVQNGKIYQNQTLINASQVIKPLKYTLLTLLQTGPTSADNISTDRGYYGRFWNGEYAEILLYSSEMTIDEKLKVESYLKSKYSPKLNFNDTTLSVNFCDSIVISAPSGFISYLWSNNDTLQSIKVKASGTYTCKVKDVFGFEQEDDISVYPYARLGNKTIYICQGNAATIDLQTPSNFNVLWNDNSTNKIKTISTAGKYTVKITDAAGCFVYDTINVIVDNPKLNPIVTAGNVTLCKNEKIFLNTATAFDSILWSNGSTDNFIPISTSGAYSVYARTTTGCILNQSFNVTIAGNAPIANYDYASLCQNNVTQFSDSSTISGGANINAWKWNFSNGASSTQQNPTTLFASTGIYSAALKVTTNQGCTDSIFKTFVVNKRPNASFSNRKSCEGNPTTFEDLSSANAASIISRKWDFAGLGNIIDIQNPAFVFPTANTYNVKLIVTNSNGCVDSITNSVKVNQSPISDFSFDAVCGKSPVNFKFLASVPTAPNPPQPTIATWQWDFGDNTFNSSIKDVSHVYATTGTYPVKLLVTSSDQCPNTIEKQVKVYEYPNVNFDISPTQCAGKDIQFTDRSVTPDGTPMTSWKWYFSGQSTDTMQNTSYAFPTQGNYTVQLTAANAVGCSGTKLRSVAVSSLPVPKFTFSPQSGLPPLIVNYNNQSPITGNYLWNYGDGSPIIQGYNPPTHTYNTKGSYPITLTATNFLGCTDTLTKFILVDKAFIDGVMSSVIIIPNGDYYQVQATILNASNIEIRDLGLTLQLGGGAVIKEDWSGSLLPGQSTVYNFIGQIKISDNSIPVICTSIDNVNNNSPEDKVDNNSTCKEVRVGTFDVLNIFPNPAIETVNFGVMLPKDGKVTIGFVDALGQKMYNKEFDGVRGYNNLAMSTVQLNAAIYIAVITYDGETRYQKFMRKDRK